MFTLKNLRKQALVLAIAGAVGIAGSAQAAVARSGPQLVMVGHATPLSRGDVVHGALPLSSTVHITVALKLRNEAQLKAYNAKPHQPMSRAQLAANHLPTSAQAQAVAAFLKSAGFTHVKISASRMLVNADASAAVASRAFHTSFAQVRTHDGRLAFANTAPLQIPAALSGSVQAVLGAQTVHKARFYAVRPHALSGGISGHFTPEFADIYGASGLAPASSVDVAVFGWGSMEQSVNDLSQFESDFGLTPTNVNVVCTDVGSSIDDQTGEIIDGGTTTIGDATCGGNYDQGSIEWSMDSQTMVGMTGGVNSLTFYAAPSGYNTYITNTLDEIVYPSVGEPLAAVVNQSFGECERFEDSNQGGDGSAQAGDELYAIGVAQGQTFSASTGDNGSDECAFQGWTPEPDSASYPASSPYNVAVSGTTLNASSTTWSRETMWVDSGGSPSSFETAPSWQTALTYGTFKGMRGPDVAFDGNPNTGAIYYAGVYGGYIQVGGTSLSSPIFVGAWARLIANGDVDPMTPAGQQLYAMPASYFHDITAGNNGGYIARRGWDWASGRGSLNLSNFSAQVPAAVIK